jgi:site-specific recombinase XerD
VLVPGGTESWTLLGDDGEVVGPAERYLAYLAAIERSPNTVRAYAISLKLWFEFLGHAAVSRDEAGVEDVARFVAWLRAPAGNVIVLADGTGARGPATVNRYLAGVFGFYDHHARAGLRVAAGLVSWRRMSRGSYEPFLHHVTKGPGHRGPAGEAARAAACATHLGACADRGDPGGVRAPAGPLPALAAGRDRDAGWPGARAAALRLRLPQARGAHRAPGADNANRARAKLRSAAVVPVPAPLVRLHPEYMHVEYGDTDSGYVFADLFGGQAGAAMTYTAVHKLIGRIAARTGIEFTAHMLRHSHATAMIRQGVPIGVVARLLTHRSSTTTSQTYVHLDAAGIREALRRAGPGGRRTREHASQARTAAASGSQR